MYHRVSMSVLKLKIGGREIVFQSEEDAARVLAALERVEEAPEKNSKTSRVQPAQQSSYNAMQGALDFLTVLMNHPNGAHSTLIAEALKCEPRGIGRRLLEVDDVLKPLGFKRAMVYDNSKRLAGGGRTYLPKQELKAAWEAVKRKAASG